MNRTPPHPPFGHPLPARGKRDEVRGTAILATFALLAGCMMGPNYERPAVDAPPKFQYEIAGAVDAGDAAWWKEFGDPVLDALVAEALAHNNNIRVAVANLEQAAAVFTQARSPLFPQIGYRGHAGPPPQRYATHPAPPPRRP